MTRSCSTNTTESETAAHSRCGWFCHMPPVHQLNHCKVQKIAELQKKPDSGRVIEGRVIEGSSPFPFEFAGSLRAEQARLRLPAACLLLPVSRRRRFGRRDAPSQLASCALLGAGATNPGRGGQAGAAHPATAPLYGAFALRILSKQWTPLGEVGLPRLCIWPAAPPVLGQVSGPTTCAWPISLASCAFEEAWPTRPATACAMYRG